MNSLIKRIATTALISVTLLLATPQKASAFLGIGDICLTFDATNETISLKQLFEDIFQFGEQIETMTQQLETTKNLWQNAKSVYNSISPYITKAKAYRSLISEAELLYFDFEQVSYIVQEMGNDPNWSVSRIHRYYNLINRIVKDVTDDYDFLKEVLSFDNSLTQEARAAKIDTLCRKFSRHHDIIHQWLDEDVTAYADKLEAAGQNESLKAFGIITASSPTEARAAITPIRPIDWESISAREKSLKASDPEMSEREAYRKAKYGEKNTLENAFAITQIIISILIALYLIVNWFRRNKGEPQHQDALMKVFGGGLASLLLLQCLKTIFIP